MAFLIVAIVLCAAIGISASIFMKGDNIVTEEASKIENELIEKELKLPPDSVHLDLNIEKDSATKK